MRSHLLFFAPLLPIVSTEAQVNPQSLVWAQDFESLSTGTLTSSSYGTSGVDGFNTSFSGNQSDPSNPRRPVVVSNQTYSGNRALRFFIPGNTSGGDSNSFRSEIAANHDGRDQPGWQDMEHYVGYAVYLDENWPITQETAVVPTVVGQLHGGAGGPGVSPVWHIAARPQGTWRLEQKFKNHQTGQNVTTATAFAHNPSMAPDRGKWVRIVVYTKFHGSCGVIRVWKDDVLEAERTCVQTYDSLNDNFGYYKFGIYAAGLKSSSGGDRLVYIDDIRVADVALGGNYATVNPDNWSGAVPAAPSSLTATPDSTTPDSQINLSWADNSSNETGFKVDRKTGAGGSYSEIATPGANATSYEDDNGSTGLAPSTQFYYRVAAVNASGASAWSSEANATTASGGTPVLHEAEDLTVSATSGDSTSTVGDAGASDGDYHLFSANAGGDYIAYTINVATADTYNVRTGITRRNNRGIYQLEIDSVDQGSAQDHYAAGSTTLFAEVDLGNVTLSAGNHTFRFDCTGKNASSNTYKLGLDYIKLTGTADTIDPTVAISTPSGGATVSGATVEVAATASDNVGVVGVQFKVDGANLGSEVTVAPYTVDWDSTAASNGSHSLTAVARDAAGNSTTSSAVSVTVDNSAPTIAITAPADEATISSGTQVTVSATASDNIGVVGVQFKVNGANLGAEDTAAPYSVSWDTSSATPGGHTLSAVARDAAGNETSDSVAVTVATATPQTELLEGEDLAVDASSGEPNNVVEDANASNGEYHLFEGNGTGDYITYTVNLPVAGAYQVITGVTARSNRGTYQLKIGGTNQGTAQDYYAAGGETQFVERDLGEVTLAAGNHLFRFECTGKNGSAVNYKMGLDYIILAVPVVHEGEDLTVSADSGDSKSIVNDGGASEGAYHLFEANASGDYITYTVNVPSAGTYNVTTGITTRSNRGIYQLKIGGVNQGAAQDHYTSGSTTQFAERDLGNVALSAGDHSFRFECTGKNASAATYKLGLDYIKLTQQ